MAGARRQHLVHGADLGVRAMSFSRIPVRIGGSSLEASRQRAAVEAKSASYKELRVGRADHRGWAAQCVVEV